MPKIKSYTVQQKLEVIRWYRANGENERQTARHFNIGRKQIYLWRKQFDTLLAHDNSRDRKKKKLTAGKAPFNIELDERLFDFFLEERLAGRAVTNGLLKRNALIFAADLKLPNFKSSTGYIRNFKKRYEISMRRGTNKAQKQPDQLVEVLNTWRLSIRCKRREHDYLPFEIANMDETMCRFDMPYQRTNEIVGKKAVRIKNTGQKKKGCTVALCAFANGDKLPAYCIFKENHGRLGPRVLSQLTVPDNVKISASQNGWMVAKNFKEWCKKVWKKTTDPDKRRRLLILDRYKPHFSPPARIILERLDTDIILIPAGCTSLVQPADVSWNKPFKTKLRELWSAWMEQEHRRQLTRTGKLKSPKRQDVIDWISQAWDCVTPEIIINSFLYTGIATALNGSQDDMIRNNLEPDIPDETEEYENMLRIFDSDDDAEIDEFYGFSDDETAADAIATTAASIDEAGPSSSYSTVSSSYSSVADQAVAMSDSSSEDEPVPSCSSLN